MKEDLIILVIVLVITVLYEYYWFVKNSKGAAETFNELCRTVATLLIFCVGYSMMIVLYHHFF